MAMLEVQRELASLKFIDGLAAHLKQVREPHKALRHALRDTREFFGATHGCIATLRAGHAEADILFALPKRSAWDPDVLTRYIRHTHPPVQRNMLIGSVRRPPSEEPVRSAFVRSRSRPIRSPTASAVASAMCVS